jgi:hypothetical protein
MPDSRKYIPMGGYKADDIVKAGKEVSKVETKRSQSYTICFKKDQKVGGFVWDIHITIHKTKNLNHNGKDIGFTVDEFHVSAKCDGYVARGLWKFSSGWKTTGWDGKNDPSKIPFGTGDPSEEKKAQNALKAAINKRAKKIGTGFGGGPVANN